MTSPRSGLPEESAAGSFDAELGKIRWAIARGVETVNMPSKMLLEICESHVALRSLLSDREETIKALRAELERWQEIKRRVLEAGGDLL